VGTAAASSNTNNIFKRCMVTDLHTRISGKTHNAWFPMSADTPLILLLLLVVVNMSQFAVIILFLRTT